MHSHLKKITVQRPVTIRELIKKMEENDPMISAIPSGIALVVDKKNKIEGIVTDGDLRKGLSRGVDLDQSVEKIMNSRPFLIVGKQSPRAMLSLIADERKKANKDFAYFDKVIIVDEAKRPLKVLSMHDLWQASDVRFKHVGVIGLGYVGLTLALTLADLGFTVRGYDMNETVKKSVKKGEPHFFEQGLLKLLSDHLGKRFTVVEDFKGENSCDVYFVAVGTPIKDGNKINVEFLESASAMLGAIVKAGDLVMLRSTVPIGTTRDIVRPLIERASGLKAGEEFHLAFAPERTVEGKALEELRALPQIIGGINHASAEIASNIFSYITKSVILVDSLEEAEMIKLLNNTYRAMTFTFANEVSMIARRWGLDTKRVIEAANYGYERSRVPLPGPGIGGYCLTKDPEIFSISARKKGYKPVLFGQVTVLSASMLDSISLDILKFIKKNKLLVGHVKVGVLGFAFKGVPVTSDVRGSTTYALMNSLKKKGMRYFSGYDPYVKRGDIELSQAKYRLSGKEAIVDHDIILVMNNNPHFAELDIRLFLEKSKGPIMLVDCWNLFSRDEIAKLPHVLHYRL